MISAIEAYLAVRRATGFKLSNDEYLLRSFARFAATRGERYIRTTTAIEWAKQTSSVAQRDRRLKTVCQFARYLRLDDDQHELPPTDHFGYHKTRRTPFIYSSAQIERLIEAALQLGPPGALRPHTYATLIALLVTTGLRIAEALALCFTDITADGLLIHKTKFQKTRLVPLHDTAVAGLEHYLRRRRQVRSEDEHLFVDEAGRALPYWSVHRTFQRLLKMAGLGSAPGGHHPRLHDFRHVFAVRTLQAGPPDHTSISQQMVALATYMGHTNIYSTYWYLEATPELLRGIAAAGETFLTGELS